MSDSAASHHPFSAWWAGIQLRRHRRRSRVASDSWWRPRRIAFTVGGEPPARANSGLHPPGFLVVAEDVLGGRFAIDGGELGVGPGTVCYFGPDSLSWVELGVGHGQFVERMLSGATTEFYDDLQWSGWEGEVEMVDLDKGLSLWPP